MAVNGFAAAQDIVDINNGVSALALVMGERVGAAETGLNALNAAFPGIQGQITSAENAATAASALVSLLTSAAGAGLIGVASGRNIQAIIDGLALEPEDFGAVGDGVADDSEALQDCFDAALTQRRGVKLANKKYRHTQPLTFKPTQWNPLNIPGTSAFAPSIDLYGTSPLSSCLLGDGIMTGAAFTLQVGIETQTTQTGNLTSGSPIITNISNTTDIQIGAEIAGTNISGTVISKTSTTVTCSANANATVVAQSITYSLFRSTGFGSIRNVSFALVNGAGGDATGIKLRSCLNTTIERVLVLGYPTGIRIQVSNGDYDGSVYTSLTDVWVHNSIKWGLNALCDPNKNELSFTRLRNVWFQNCGNPAEPFKAVPNPATNDDPQSGAVIFKGQNLLWNMGGWTVCHGVGFYMRGENGVGSDAVLENLSAENSGPRQVLCTGTNGLTLRRVHFYNSNIYQATVLSETWSAGTWGCLNVRYEDCRVRCTAGAATGGAGQPLTAFKNTKAATFSPDQIPVVSGLIWQSFGGAGQVGFSGDWHFGGIPNQSYLTFAGQTVTLLADPLKGSIIPLAIRWGGNGLFLETGQVVPHTIREVGYSLDTSALANGTYNVYVYDSGNVVALVSGIPSIPNMVHGHPRRPDQTGLIYMGRFSRAAGALLVGAAANWLNPTWVTGGWSWVNSAGKAMIKATTAPTYASLPSSDTDGVIVGTQT